MTDLRPRHVLLTLVAALTLFASACTGGSDETTNGAIASSGDVSDGAAGNEESQTSDGSTTMDGDLPAESETGIGDDPVNGGAQTGADEQEPVVESADGLSSEPVNGGASPTPSAEPSNNEVELVGPAMPASAAEICAVVEFGYLGLLDGDSGEEVQARLREGATSAAALADKRYATAGAGLLDAVGTAAMSSSADALLDVCALDGFERLA